MIRATRAVPAPLAASYRAQGVWHDRLADSYVSEAARQHPDRIAVVGPRNEPTTYRELDALIDDFASALDAYDIQAGDVVSWQLPNWLEAVVTHHGIIRRGAVSNPIAPIYRAKDVGFVLRQARSKLFVVVGEFRGFNYLTMTDSMLADLPQLREIVVVGHHDRDHRLSFDEFMAAGKIPLTPVERTPDDIITLMYTSGTTADPKGVLHSHNTLVSENITAIETFGMVDADAVFMPSPVTHITGVLYGIQLAPMLSSTLVLQDLWEPTLALKLLSEHRCAFMAGATPFLAALVHHPQLNDYDLSALKFYPCGGADVSPALIYEGVEALGCVLPRMYGSSEFPSATVSTKDDPVEKWATTDGKEYPHTKFRIVDGNGDDCPPGVDGDILVQGPELFLGYLDATLNEAAFTSDGWFDTGDRGVRSHDGFLTITGRKKDIIVRGGENISAKLIEDGILTMPGVTDAVVVSAPDPVLVERVAVFIVADDESSITLTTIGQHLRDLGFANQQIPELLFIVDSVPRTESGKIQKYVLRDRLRTDGFGAAKEIRGGIGGSDVRR